MIYSVIKEEKSLTEIFKEYDIDIDFEVFSEGVGKNIIRDIKRYIMMLIHKIEEFIDNIIFNIKKKFLVNQSFLKKNRDKIIIGCKIISLNNNNTATPIEYYDINYFDDIDFDITNIKFIDGDRHLDWSMYNPENVKKLKNSFKNKREEILTKLKKENLKKFTRDFDDDSINFLLGDIYSKDIKDLIKYKRESKNNLSYLYNLIQDIFNKENDKDHKNDLLVICKELYGLIIKAIKTKTYCVMSNYITDSKFAMKCIKAYDKEKNQETDNFEIMMNNINTSYNSLNIQDEELEEFDMSIDDEPVDESTSIFSNITLI